MGKISTLIKMLRNNEDIGFAVSSNVAHCPLFRFLPDKLYLNMRYWPIFGKKINFKEPKTFNEKINWLKLYDRKPEYIMMADKYRVRDYIAKTIGEEYLIPLLGVWDRAEDIDFNSLPNQFVLKCNHDSGSVIICKDKSCFDYDYARKKLAERLKFNLYYFGREWVYKDIKPCIIAEKYMTDGNNQLKDYKIFNFNGEPEFIQVDYDRFVKHKRNLYSVDWSFMEESFQYQADPEVDILRPKKLDNMLNLARKISENHSFLRTDFYDIDGRIYFGEMTFYPEAGFGKFNPEDYDVDLGELIKLPEGGA